MVDRIDEDATLGSGWATGTTVVLTPPGTVGAADVRGGAPGTRETDLLDPANSVRHVDAVVLSGGSAYGLAAADGVMACADTSSLGPGPGSFISGPSMVNPRALPCSRSGVASAVTGRAPA